MSLKNATPEDPRGLIAESYHIENLDEQSARSIFLDWAMNDASVDPIATIQILYDRYQGDFPAHPMTLILQEGLSKPVQKTRKGRRTSK